MSNEYLIEMVDGGLIKYEDDCYRSCDGCPTCGYGEEYTTDIMMYFNDFNFNVTIENDRTVDQGFIMSLFIKNLENIKRMTEEQFVNWFKDNLEIKYSNNYIKFKKYIDGEIEVI